MSDTEADSAATALTGGQSAPDFFAETEPLRLFDGWLEEARRGEPNDPNAMALATVDDAGMPDVRIITHEGAPVAAMLRLPTLASGGRANLHQGGIGAAVDLETGRVVAARWMRRACTHHPDTGAELIGLQVPAWSQVLETAAACAEVTGLGYSGADIVFDRVLGHLVLEVNARPGLEIQNVRSRGLRPDLLGAELDRPIRMPAFLAGAAAMARRDDSGSPTLTSARSGPEPQVA